MKEVLPYLESAGAIAFSMLDVVTAVRWAKGRDRSRGFLARAIVVLSWWQRDERPVESKEGIGEQVPSSISNAS
ncbi:MAG TPA: hypothetical protein VND96_15660 [Candidatus Micrarchaeaceae archaeon]|nr:hypothetical protein [Candidatus Micrarchaeaceae archaeon]